MPTTQRRTAAEIIGTALCTDIESVRDSAYQPTRYRGIYSMGDYYCCPTAGAKPPYRNRWNWTPVETLYGRTVYRCRVEDQRDDD